MSGNKENDKSQDQQDQEDRATEAHIAALKAEIVELDQISEEKLRQIQDMHRLIADLQARLDAAKSARKK